MNSRAFDLNDLIQHRCINMIPQWNSSSLTKIKPNQQSRWSFKRLFLFFVFCADVPLAKKAWNKCVFDGIIKSWECYSSRGQFFPRHKMKHTLEVELWLHQYSLSLLGERRSQSYLASHDSWQPSKWRALFGIFKELFNVTIYLFILAL